MAIELFFYVQWLLALLNKQLILQIIYEEGVTII